MPPVRPSTYIESSLKQCHMTEFPTAEESRRPPAAGRLVALGLWIGLGLDRHVAERRPNLNDFEFATSSSSPVTLNVARKVTWGPMASESQNLLRKTIEHLRMGCELEFASIESAVMCGSVLKPLAFDWIATRV